jgi:predicted aldo/keto reductase-like oxidoreductase
MQTRYFKNLGDRVSLLGFGLMRLPRITEDKQDIHFDRGAEMVDYACNRGVNYFDTGWNYHDGLCEPFAGEVLKRYRRKNFFLAAKLPVWLLNSREEAQQTFEEQLKRCQVDYFDYYLFHGINGGTFDKLKKLGFYELLLREKEKGRIRHLGFSFHDKAETLERIVEAHPWDFAQIQINYLDWEQQNAKRQYEILCDAGLPVVVMESIKGGSLASLGSKALEILTARDRNASQASWALRYAASLPQVLTVLSGMSNLEQVKDNIATFIDFHPLTKEDYVTLDEAAAAYLSQGIIPCTGCRYCMDCPSGVDIPKNLSLYNQFLMTKDSLQFYLSYLVLSIHQSRYCTDCRQCTARCPQKIDIPTWLREISAAKEKD